MNRHFLVHWSVDGSHTYVCLLRSASLREALVTMSTSNDDTVRVLEDGSVHMDYGAREIRYPHIVAYIEANYKVNGGTWDIRMLPESAWSASYFEGAFVNDHPDEVRDAIQRCGAKLKRELPKGSDAFVWRLREGMLVSFVRRTGAFQTQPIRRFLIPESNTNEVVDWEGDYEAILRSLWTGPDYGETA